MSDLINDTWYVGTCSSGESCWCRTISTKPNGDPDEDEMDYCIAHAGCLSKDVAEHIVKIHNEWLEGKNAL